MKRIYWYVMKRMMINFILLFTILFLLGALIDLVVNLDEFVKVATMSAEDEGWWSKAVAIVQVGIGFEGPRVFQMYAYLYGLVAVGAMGFTLAQMYRSRELVAIMAAGVGLHRLAVPLFLVMTALGIVQLANQEYMLPRVAPLLLRGHGESGSATAGGFRVPFTPDRRGTLLLARELDPGSETLIDPSFLERNESGRMIRRISASRGIWTEDPPGWALEGGTAIAIALDEQTGAVTPSPPVPISFYATELSPHLLTLHRYGQYLGMLSMSQLDQMLDVAGTFDGPLLRRHWYARFAMLLLNILSLLIVIPFFLTRDVMSVVTRAMWCAGAAITMMFGGALTMMLPMPGVPAMVSVFLPAVVLFPIALVRLASLRT